MSNEPLRCTNCGQTAGYADASLADSYRTCGGDGVPDEVIDDSGHVRYAYAGEKHDWAEQ